MNKKLKITKVRKKEIIYQIDVPKRWEGLHKTQFTILKYRNQEYVLSSLLGRPRMTSDELRAIASKLDELNKK